MKIFRRNEINPFSVSDKVTFRNVDKTLTLTVRADASALVLGIKRANAHISALTDENTEADTETAARFFASVIFGEDQAARLYDFYGNPLTVISVLGIYFRDRLANKITKAQKRK